MRKRLHAVPAVRFFLMMLAALFFCVGSVDEQAFAQGEDGGTQPIFQSVGGGIGARAQSLGNAFVARADDGSAVFWNPAGLDYLFQQQVTFYHSNLIEGAAYDFISYTHPTVRFGSVGIGVVRLAVDGIVTTNSFNDVINPNGTFDNEEFYLSYGKKLPWFNLSAGSTIKAVRQAGSNFDETATTSLENDKSGIGIGIDVGLLYRPDFEHAALRDLSLGVNIQNLIQPSFKIVDDDDFYPINLKVGLAKAFRFGALEDQAISVLFDYDRTTTAVNRFHFGAEYQYRQIVSARVGLDHSAPTFGIGAVINKYQNFQVDYTFSMPVGSAFGAFHRFSLAIGFGQTVDEKIAADIERRALEDQLMVESQREEDRLKNLNERISSGKISFNEGNYIQALVDFESALRFDEKNKEAKDYLEQIDTKLEEQLTAQLNAAAEEAASKAIEETIIAERGKFIKERYDKAIEHLKNERFLDAISEFELALEKDPDNVIISEGLKAARESLETQIDRYINLARSRAAQNNFAEAMDLLGEARSLDPNNEAIQAIINAEARKITGRLRFLEISKTGLSLYENGDYEAAYQEFEKALLINPNDETVNEYYQKAKVRALATFKPLDQVQEKSYLGGVNAYVKGNYQEAISAWEKILEKDPYNKKVLNAIDEAQKQLKSQSKKP